MVSMMGGVMVTVAPIIINVCITGGFPIMIIFAILSGVSGFLSSRLSQTFGLIPPDEIKELKDSHDDQVIKKSLLETEVLFKKDEDLATEKT